MTPKTADLGPPPRCRRCVVSGGTVWVAADLNYYVSACTNCFDTAQYWGALCPKCGAMFVEHRDNGSCPRNAEFEEYERGMPEARADKLKALPSMEDAGIIEAEVVELPCSCSPPRYDRDCPQHEVHSEGMN